jgi:peptide/nickel transport system ATP-binding protein
VDVGSGARLLEARDVKVTFAAPGAVLSFLRRGPRKTVKAVDGMTLFVNEGRTLGVVGESGSGKTTMARAVIGLVEPSAGEITLRGRSLERSTAKRPREVLKRIQMVFQNPDASLNPQRSVGAAIARPLTLLTGADRSQVRERVLALLEAVHLPPSYYDRLPGELSGGEKQRVAIARAFAAEPELVLCDEPISSLDVSVQGSLMNLLMDLQAQKDTSYLFISHDLAAVQHLSDWIAVVYLGLIMELGASARVLLPPYHPYTEALLSAIPVADPDIEQKAIRLEGGVPSALDIPPGCRFHTRCPRVLGDICREQEPPWRLGEGDHWIYCHIPLGELRGLQAETIRFSDSADVRAGVADLGEGA